MEYLPVVVLVSSFSAIVMDRPRDPTTGEVQAGDDHLWDRGTITNLPSPPGAPPGTGTPIPDNNTNGISSDILVGNAQQNYYGIKVQVNLIHLRPADLYIDLRTVSANGSTLHAEVLFDGTGDFPSDNVFVVSNRILATAGQTVPGQPNTTRWQLNVSDRVQNNTGNLISWTLFRRVALFEYAHWPFETAYFQGLLFGTGKIGSAGGDMGSGRSHPIQKPNAADYFRAVSRGKLNLTNAGVFIHEFPYQDWVPLTYDRLGHKDEMDRKHVHAVAFALEDKGFDFKRFDRNGDGVITSDDLIIVAVDNYNDIGARNRGGQEIDEIDLPRSGLKFRGKVAHVGEEVGFASLVHEMSHSLRGPLGIPDLYGIWNEECKSHFMTLMSCTIHPLPEDKKTVFMDPWCRWKLGWVYPNPNSLPNLDPNLLHIGQVGEIELGDDTWQDLWHRSGGAPAILYNPDRRKNEYFLFEFRSGVEYDNFVADRGLVVWHVREYDNGEPYKGVDGNKPEGHAIYVVSPDDDFGGSKAWHASDGNFQLHWDDYARIPLTFWVEESPRSREFPYSHSFNSIILHYMVAPINNPPPRVQIIQPPADNSSGPYGFGRPTVFEAIAIDSQGNPTDMTGFRFNWKSNIEGPIGSGNRISYGFSSPGPRRITVTMRDTYGATAGRTINYDVTGAEPTAAIFSPAKGAKFLRNEPIFLSGLGSSPATFGLPCSRLSWSFTTDPPNHLPSPRYNTIIDIDGRDMDGRCQGVTRFDRIGRVSIRLTVTDEFNPPFQSSGTTDHEINLDNPPPGSAPRVTILEPQGGEVRDEDWVHVRGEVSDPAGGRVTYRWTFRPGTLRPADTDTDTELSNLPLFDWRVSTKASTVILNLYGTNDRDVTTLASRTYRVTRPPR